MGYILGSDLTEHTTHTSTYTENLNYIYLMHKHLHNLDLIGYVIIVPYNMQGPNKLLHTERNFIRVSVRKNLRVFAFTYSH
jgi:hypothetical protein